MSKGSARRKQQVSNEQLSSSWETIFGSKHGRTISNSENTGRTLGADRGKHETDGGNRSNEADAQSTSNPADCRDSGASAVDRD